MDSFSYQVFQSTTQRNLILSKDKILISVSGGVDSVSLLHILLNFQSKIDFEIRLVHFNHGIRPESASEEIFLEKLANHLSIPIDIIRTDHLKDQNDLQNKARIWRYNKLQELLKQLRFNKIALGHHLNDLMETQVWRLIRGSSVYSLNPIQDINLPYIRPLLRYTKSNLITFLNSIRQEWMEDSSNLSDDYTRNTIRNKLVPIMHQCAGGKLEEKFLGLYNEIEELEEVFHHYVPKECYQIECLNFKMIRDLPALFAKELIHRFLLFHQVQILNRYQIQTIFDLIRQNKGNWKISLHGETVAQGKNKLLRVIRET
ncbi:MAG: tRNA lysidine(34) synthetase TilS [Deltaproteobacteria bacterium]|nr:tRNA lysidine(34) synthetase TilS [Deltaproteobacteria bacterium]